jgi:hypothetical protein
MSQTSQDAVFQEKSDDEGENGELLAINPGKPRFALSSSVCFVFLRKPPSNGKRKRFFPWRPVVDTKKNKNQNATSMRNF